MKLIVQQVFSQGSFISSNVPEDDYPPYDAFASYLVGDRVMVLGDYHKVYEALVNVTGIWPPEGVNRFPPEWLEIGSTNRWGMFDSTAGTETRHPLLIDTVSTMPDPFNAIAFFGVEADQLHIIVKDSGNVTIFNRVENLVIPPLEPEEPPQRKSDFAIFDMPSAPGATFQLTFSAAAGDVACGLIAVGTKRTIGTTSYGSGFGIIDYSRKETDSFGRPIIVRRRFSKKARLSMTLLTEQVDRTQKILSDHRATPMAWVGSDELQSSVIYGFYRDFEISVGPVVSQCRLELEGLF